MGTIDQEIAAFINDGQTKEQAQELYESLNNINDYENCKWGYTFLNASSIYDNVSFNFSGTSLLPVPLPVPLPVSRSVQSYITNCLTKSKLVKTLISTLLWRSFTAT